MSQKRFNVLKPVYHRLGDPMSLRTRTHPDDQFRVTWACVGQAADMEDAKRLLCRPVLEAINQPERRG